MKRKLTIGLLFTLALAVCTTNLMAAEAWSESTEIQKSVKVSGTVKDSAGAPVLGATVIQADNQTNGMTTDANGNFVLTVPEGANVVVSYIGYVAQTVKAYDGMIVTLKDDAQMIDDVVVVGFGTQKKANLTGAVSSVDVAKTFESKPIVDVSKGLQGTVPGLTITFGTADLGESASIKVRGTTSVYGNNTPLILLDGVEISDLSFVNPDNIANISVLKDAASASIYGTRGAYGVVLITSKDGSEMKDRAKITYSANFAWNDPIDLPKYATGYDVLDAMHFTMLANENTSGTYDSEAFGMYYSKLLDPMKEWLDNNLEAYNNGELGQTYVYGRDYEYNASGVAHFYRVVDPNKEILKDNAFQHSHNLTVAGSAGKTSYNVSMNYYKQDGLLKMAEEQSMQRVTANVSTSSQVKKWLRVGTKMMYTEKVFKYPNSNSGSGSNLFTYTMRFPTFFPFGISDGGIDPNTGESVSAAAAGGKGLYFRHGNGFVVGYPTQKGQDDYMRVGANVDINIVKGLTFHADYTRSILNYISNGVSMPVYVANWWSAYSPKYALVSTNSVSKTIVKNRANAFNAYFDYNVAFCKDHNLAVKLGFNSDDYFTQTIGATSLNMINTLYPVLSLTENANGKATVSESKKKRAAAGFFGRINYSWKDKLLLELNGRFDGSSKFAAGQKWGFFPSGSIGYRLSEENFMKNQNVISNLKVRASYGMIGNEDVSAGSYYPFMTTIGNSTISWIGPNSANGALTYAGMPGVSNPALTWESIETIDVGLDLGFLNNDLNIVFDWYQRQTTGMLVTADQVAYEIGIATMHKVNGGNMRTRGWEVQVDYNHSFNKDFRIYATATLADSKAKITDWGTNTGAITGYYVGKEWGEIWGFKTADAYFTADEAANGVLLADGSRVGINEVYQKALYKSGFRYGEGDVKYEDLNGDGKVDSGKGTISDHGDLIRIGNTTPRYEYSLRAGLQWKGLDFEFLFQGVGKREMWSQSSRILPLTQGRSTNIFTDQLDYYTPENPDAKFPRPYIGHTGSINGLSNGANNYYSQTKYLSNMAYLRLKNVTLGYTLPKNLTMKATIEKVRVYVSAQNLLTFDHLNGAIDPEYNVSGTADTGGRGNPFCRTWSCGVQISF
ncbi:MAG: TonB-dependent receptor [Rikenellaceae bacterium]|nr:TonB-dependent receptor [Rikenellaceae bacterium]